MNSSKSFVDNIVTLDFDDYNDDDENYDEENNEEGSVPINDVKYSYGTMCAIVKYSKTPTFQSLRHRYRHVKHKEQLRRINYGNPSTRMLTRTGEKTTMCSVKSMNAVTHSYTIMPIINMLGELVGPVFICLQEPNGRLGPRVKPSIYSSANIHVTCSKSGKLTKSHIQYLAEKVLRPSVSDDCLLLLDSWSGQTNPEIYSKIFNGNIKCEQLQIPPKTTGVIQPLDRYFFRQWKYFKQKNCDRLAIDDINIDIAARNNVLKMHSLIHNQLTARKFISMIKYSWYSSGYLLDDPGFQVTTIAEASKIGHIFVTATGSTELIRGEHILEMRDMAILCNIGSGQTEIDVAWLKVNATKIENLKPHVDIYHLPNGRAIILPADGRVINLSCAHGNPSFVMSNSFSNQILAQIELYTKKGHYPVGIHILPKTLDEEVAMAHLEYLGIKLDKLTVNQSAYIDVHPDGPFKPIYYRY
ncbi:unnamed protein product [Rotaria magnacalcarata]|uniref:S-adenosyl-L-homocysteine hydrolase NAD binding domain-containing protein n=1 Tax=Rotaria magnacalcarata TaxID=392030 RepID=A0A816NBT8_9BILA|nr:unnamed protein product [Rotaria magnacalcarata]